MKRIHPLCPLTRTFIVTAFIVSLAAPVAPAWSDGTRLSEGAKTGNADASDAKQDGKSDRPNAADGLLDPALPHETQWQRYKDAAIKFYKFTPEQTEIVAGIYEGCCNRAKLVRKAGDEKESAGNETTDGAKIRLDKLTHELVYRIDAIARKDQIEAASKDGFDSPLKKTPLPKPEPGNPAPDFTLNTAEGKPLTLSAMRGNVVVLTFWASWCGYCKKTLPDIQILQEYYKDNGEVVILGVNCREKEPDSAKALAILKEKEYTFPVVYQGDSAASSYEVAGFPTLFVIGPDGDIIHKQRGHKDNVSKLLIPVIDNALKNKRAAAAGKDSQTRASAATGR